MLLLYIASVGPAVLMYGSCPPLMQQALAKVYAPLEWLDEALPGAPISKYCDLWRRN